MPTAWRWDARRLNQRTGPNGCLFLQPEASHWFRLAAG